MDIQTLRDSIIIKRKIQRFGIYWTCLSSNQITVNYFVLIPKFDAETDKESVGGKQLPSFVNASHLTLSKILISEISVRNACRLAKIACSSK